MEQRLRIRRDDPAQRGRLLDAIMTRLPRAWFSPKSDELIALYRLRCRMALDEEKYDIAMVFLNKILEVEPANAEAKLQKGEIYHRHLRDYSRAIEQYNKVIRLTASDRASEVHLRARDSLSEIMEMLS